MNCRGSPGAATRSFSVARGLPSVWVVASAAMGHVGVRFRVLGAFEAQGPDGPLDLGGPKRRALLALLVLRAGQSTSVEAIVDALWGDGAPAGAPRTVRTYVSQLRKQLADGLGPGAVHVRGGPLRARHRRRRRRRRVRAAGHGRDRRARPRRACGRPRRRTGLWRGDPLPEFAGAGWADQALNHWRRLHRVAQEGRTDALLALGRHREVLPLLERLVVDEPLHERYWAQLVVARHGAGRRSDALGAAREVRRILGLELGIEPGSEILDLERRIIDGDDDLLAPALPRPAAARVVDVPPRDRLAARPVVVPPAPAPAGAGRGAARAAPTVAIDLTAAAPPGQRPFVGRADDLGAVRSAIDRACVGEGGVALVTGEPGIGKSRLVEEATRDCATRGVRRAVGAGVRVRRGAGVLALAPGPAVRGRRRGRHGPRGPGR